MIITTKEECSSKNKNRDWTIVAIFLFVIMLGTSVVACYIKNDSWIPEFSVLAVAFFLATTMVLFLFYEKQTAFSNPFHVFLIPMLLLISCILLLTLDDMVNICFYLISGIIFAKYVNIHFQDVKR